MNEGVFELEEKQYGLQEIAHNIYIIEESDVCIYVLIGTESAAVIDTGYGSFNLYEAVRKLTDKPLVTICTHGHPDHFLGAGCFDEVYLNDRDIPVAELYGARYKQEVKHHMQERFKMSDTQIEQWVHSGPPKIISIYPGMEFNLGGYSLETVDLCGHTLGSIGLICKQARILFSGDGVIERAWLHLPESASVQRYYETIKKLNCREREFDQIHTGHKNAHKPVSFLKELTGLLELVLEEREGIPINTGAGDGLLAGKTGCQIIFNAVHVSE
jgi:glyoxylase-like metal-dependent hydrolase (beta-lactamase superfamily II)